MFTGTLSAAWLLNLTASVGSARSDAIFFHFLNRELQRTLRTPIPPALVARVMLAILTCTRGPHFTTMSFLMEGGLGMSPDLLFLEALINRQMIDVISDSMTLEDHVLSHRRQYRHDDQRYPEYFDDDFLKNVTFHPTKFKEQDTTVHLSATLRATFASRASVLELPFPGTFKVFFDDARTRIFDVLAANEGRGITMSLFRDIVHENDHRSLAMIGQLLSYYHIRHYLDYCQADICTSVPGGIAELDIAARFPPIFDWSIFRVICNGLYGYDSRGLTPDLYHFVSAVAGTSIHRRLVTMIQQLVFGAMFVALRNGSMPLHEVRAQARRFLESSFGFPSQTGLANVVDLQTLDLNLWLERAFNALHRAGENSAFREFIQMTQASSQRRAGKVMILTATDTEISVALSEFAKKFSRQPKRDYIGTTTIYLLGPIGNSDVILAQGNMSDEGPDAISMKTVELIDRIKPDYVILSGICLGLQRQKQQLGDLILSRDVRNYNLHKVTEENGKMVAIPRGARVPSSPTLMDRFRSGKIDWKTCRVDPGLLMSGSLLVNHPGVVQALKDLEPEALAAEMEGAGLFAACMRKKVDWIIVKGISDWGIKKDDSAQELAARNSIQFVYAVIGEGGLFAGT